MPVFILTLLNVRMSTLTGGKKGAKTKQPPPYLTIPSREHENYVVLYAVKLHLIYGSPNRLFKICEIFELESGLPWLFSI